MAYVECTKCKHKEEANKSFFLKVLGCSGTVNLAT
jgi:hypothetical protein